MRIRPNKADRSVGKKAAEFCLPQLFSELKLFLSVQEFFETEINLCVVNFYEIRGGFAIAEIFFAA